MPPKAKIAAPIDRPLSRAYVREFTGWSTADPPGISDPTSLRIMENVMINRDGSAGIRPGLRYLSYQESPYDYTAPPPTEEPEVGWSAVPAMPGGRRIQHATTVIENKIYVTGGYRIDQSDAGDLANQTAETLVYDPDTNAWTVVAPMPTVGIPLAAGLINGLWHVYLKIDRTPRGDTSADVDDRHLYIYNPDTDSWIEDDPVPPAKLAIGQNAGDQVVDGKLYQFAYQAAGSSNTYTVSSKQIQSYSPDTGWNQTLPSTASIGVGFFYGHSTLAYDGKLWLFDAGWNSSAGFVGYYDPALNSWVTLSTAVPNTLIFTAVARHAGKFYFAGGDLASGAPESTNVNIYDPVLNTWTASTPLPAATRSAGAAVIGTTLYIIGGTSASNYRIRLGGVPDDDRLPEALPFSESIGGLMPDPVGGGIGFALPFVGTHEPFYLNDGTKAYLVGVREEDETVGFRVMVPGVNDSAMYSLQDPLIDFDIEQPLEVLNFSSGTTYITYLQIDNKIFALSDNGEPMRLFTVGATKSAKALASITRPDFTTEDKLTVVHPDAAWINAGEPAGRRVNRVRNPSFEKNLQFWEPRGLTDINRPTTSPVPPVRGSRVMRMQSLPERTNLVTSPLHAVGSTGIVGWSGARNDPELSSSGGYLRIGMLAKKSYLTTSKLLPGVKAGKTYQVAYDLDCGAHVEALLVVRWFGSNGAQIDDDVVKTPSTSTGRKVSVEMTAPKGAVSARVLFGGNNQQNDPTFVRVKNVVMCLADEATSAFTGASGANYFWTGDTNDSASVFHPPAEISVVSDTEVVLGNRKLSGSLHVRAQDTARDVTLTMRMFNKDGVQVAVENSAATADTAGVWTRLEANRTLTPATCTNATLRVTIPAVPRGEYHYVDAVLLESLVDVAGDYFDGSLPDIPTAHRSWGGTPHESDSIELLYVVSAVIPPAETKTVDTLIATGGAANNTYNFGFFYTFENEVGESAASRPTVVRTQRGWSDWAWELPNAAGEPSGTDTNDPDRAADQLVAYMPEDVYDEALGQGATKWNLYLYTWSNQDAAPATALQVKTKEFKPDTTYDADGWLNVTPQQQTSSDVAPLPTRGNRFNYSNPSRGGQGLVAGDRMVLVKDPTSAAVIRYSSNQLGEYTNFTAAKGGGYKTLTSGNLYIPACVKLWQNPQSADTITILCLGTDGRSTSYYMAPAEVSSQTAAVQVMGFEETTATPGTTSPYGVEVFNNSLYHPLEDQLMKSTASNYNINHKSQTEMIRDRWEKLITKEWIMSAHHDSRIYYIVNNPAGEALEAGCKGNEIWVFDAAATNGTWSRFLIQGHALRAIEVGGHIYMSVIRPDGVYYLDPEYAFDDVPDATTQLVTARGIPWRLESNTQGANRAHDAWAHLQQLSVTLGYFRGRMRFGLRSVDINGKAVDMSKVVRDAGEATAEAYDIEEMLLVRRDLREWYFYAESLTDDDGLVEPSFGQVSLVQFRYTPVSVNVGYEYGSVETFEYGRDLAGAATTSVNGTPLPLQDSRRP